VIVTAVPIGPAPRLKPVTTGSGSSHAWDGTPAARGSAALRLAGGRSSREVRMRNSTP